MSGIRRVAGLGLDGSNVSITFGKVEIECISATYGDKVEKGTLSAMGAQQIDEVTQGTYSIDDCKIKMSSVRFRTLLIPAMPATGGGNVRMPLVVGRSHPELGDDSDLLDGSYITNWGAAVENSSKAEEVELTCKVTQILWTNERKTINQLRGVPAGAHAF